MKRQPEDRGALRTADFSRQEFGPTKVGGPKTALGWYSRGYLPHLDTPGVLQAVTFRLSDSLPHHVLEQMRQESQDDPDRMQVIEPLLDAGHGACWLRNPEIATLVEAALLRGDGEQYRLLCWTLMPNHVHVLIETLPDHPLFRVVQGWKGASALAANRLLHRTGAFWARDYFDRYIRDEAHLATLGNYIDRNPVKAGLVERPEDWPFGSARLLRTADFSRQEHTPTKVGGPNDMHDLIDKETECAVQFYLARVAAQYDLAGAVLFGSRARRDHRPDSDADLALLLRGPHRPFLDTKLELADIAFDALLETGVLIQPLPIWEDEWEHPEVHIAPALIRNVKREGIRL